MQEIPIDSLPPQHRTQLDNSIFVYHEKLVEETEFKPAKLLIEDSEYQFVTNAEETLTLLLPSIPILNRKKTT